MATVTGQKSGNFAALLMRDAARRQRGICAACQAKATLFRLRRANTGYELVCAFGCPTYDTMAKPIDYKPTKRKRGRPRTMPQWYFEVQLAELAHKLGPGATLADLREAIGMSERTFRRYIAPLRDAPVDADNVHRPIEPHLGPQRP